MKVGLFLAALLFAQDDWSKFRSEAFRKEEQGAWKKIAWQKDMGAAFEKAKADGKPILVFLVVGERGQKNAPEC